MFQLDSLATGFERSLAYSVYSNSDSCLTTELANEYPDNTW